MYAGADDLFGQVVDTLQGVCDLQTLTSGPSECPVFRTSVRRVRLAPELARRAESLAGETVLSRSSRRS